MVRGNSGHRVRRIDRYVFKEVLSPFVGGVAFIAFVFLMFQILRLAEFFIVNGAPLSQLIPLMGFLSMSFLPLGLPIAFLTGILIAFGRFSTDSEIVAMKATGMSLPRIAAPVMVLAMGVAMLSLMLNLEWVPYAETSARRILLKIGNSKLASSFQEGTFSRGLGSLLMFAEKVNNKTGRMERVFIFDERDAKHPVTVIAKDGEIIRIQDGEDDVSGLVMNLQKGSIHQSETASDSYNKIDYENYQIYIDTPQSNSALTYKPKMMGVGALLEKRDAELVGTPGWLELNTEFWRRIATAFAPLMFVLLGIGVGTVRTRGARFGVMLVAVVVSAVYWQMQVSAIWLGNSGRLSAPLALQLPNLIMGGLGAIFFKRASW